MIPIPQLYAQDIHKAVDGMGTAESTIIEIVCSLTNAEIRAVALSYEHSKEYSYI